MSRVYLDIPSFEGRVKDDFVWPVPYSDYDFLSYGFVDEALKILAAHSGDVHIALTCKLSDILIDIMHVARVALEIERAGEQGFECQYHPKASKTAHFLMGQGESALRHARQRSWRDFAHYARYEFHRLSGGVDGRAGADYHTLNPNALMGEWCGAQDMPGIALPVEFYTHGFKTASDPVIADIAQSFASALQDRYGFDLPVSQAINESIHYHMEQALGDLARLKRSGLNRHLKAGLVSGTPKYEGRLLSWYAQDHGKDVIRFAHGGERVFYEDYIWPIAELPYCYEYYAHSGAEADAMAARVQNGTYAVTPEMADIEFKSVGSQKHQAVFESAKPPAKNKTLVYVTGVYLGDLAPNFPAFKIPDSLYFDFQIRLLKLLKSNDWNVILKPHPKGLYAPADLLRPYVDDVVLTPFDPNAFEAELCLFDFAGTAFFDTLFSKQRMTLLNMGGRRFDAAHRDDLDGRCSILDMGWDGNNLADISDADILKAIDSTPDPINSEFVQNYAGSK
jgi:hypothetical protein